MSFSRSRLLPLCSLSLSLLLGCSAQHGPRDTRSDDAPPASSLAKLVHDVFAEMERDAELRCECYVESGRFASQQACMDEVGRGAQNITCLEKSIEAVPHEELRAPFECMLEERLQTNECLETAACDEQLELCYAMPRDCPMADATLLTQLARKCPGAIGAAR